MTVSSAQQNARPDTGQLLIGNSNKSQSLVSRPGGSFQLIKKLSVEDVEKKKKLSFLQLISIEEGLIVEFPDGKNFIDDIAKTLKLRVDRNPERLDIRSPDPPTDDVMINVIEILSDGTFLEVFPSIPGDWNQKWLPHSQVIGYCKTLPSWFYKRGLATMFLIKKDENKPVDENDPADNLSVIRVRIFYDGMHINNYFLDDDFFWYGLNRTRFVYPEIF